jgi:hypothetical protein
MNLFLIKLIFLNPLSQKVVETENTDTVESKFPNTGNWSLLDNTLFKTSLDLIPLPRTSNLYHLLRILHLKVSKSVSEMRVAA